MANFGCFSLILVKFGLNLDIFWLILAYNGLFLTNYGKFWLKFSQFAIFLPQIPQICLFTATPPALAKSNFIH